MIKLLILADDFTGTLDTAVQLTEKGIGVRISANPEEEIRDDDYEVLAVDLETRRLTAQEAYNRVYKIAKRAKAAGVKHIYKKTDSNLRGNVGSELGALLAVYEEEPLCFVPAHPEAGRTTKDDIQYLHGVPIHESIFGKDPYEPVRFSRVDEVIKETSEVCTRMIKKDEFPSCVKEYQGCSIKSEVLVVDAETPEEICQTADLLSRAHGISLYAGCAGFAAELDRIIDFQRIEQRCKPSVDKLIMISGSLNQVTKCQIEEYEEFASGNLGRVTLAPDQKLDKDYFRQIDTQKSYDAIKKRIKEHEVCIIDTFDRVSDETKQIAIKTGLSVKNIGERIAENVGDLMERLIEDFPRALYMLTGGDTLYGYLKKHEKAEIIPLREVEKGVVLTMARENGKILYMVTKAGGLGTKQVIENTKRYMKERKKEN